MTQETKVETVRQSPSTPEDAHERRLRKFLLDFALALLLAIVAALVVDIALHAREHDDRVQNSECDAKISKALSGGGLSRVLLPCGERYRGEVEVEI